MPKARIKVSSSQGVTVNRYKERQADEILSQLVDAEMKVIPDYYGDAELGDVEINGQDSCVILRLFDGEQTHEAVLLNPHFLVSSRKMKNAKIEHKGVALLHRVEKYFEHNLPPPMSKWEWSLDQDMASNSNSVPEQVRDEFLDEVKKNLFYELN